jgi:hypothetical protein
MGYTQRLAGGNLSGARTRSAASRAGVTQLAECLLPKRSVTRPTPLPFSILIELDCPPTLSKQRDSGGLLLGGQSGSGCGDRVRRVSEQRAPVVEGDAEVAPPL